MPNFNEMINITDDIVFLTSELKLSIATINVVDELLSRAVENEPFPYDYDSSTNRQLRRRHSFTAVFRNRNKLPYTQSDISAIFIIATKDRATSNATNKAFETVAGRPAKYDEDIEGLKILCRAVLIGLWASDDILLTPTFPRKGIDSRLSGFLDSKDAPLYKALISSGTTKTILRYGRNIFYTTNMKTLEEVNFKTLWEAVTLQVAYFKNTSSNARNYPLSSLVSEISKLDPNIISQSKSSLYEKFHLSQANSTELVNITPENFESYINLPDHKRTRVRDSKYRQRKKSEKVENPSRNGSEDFFQGIGVTAKRGSDFSWLHDGWYSGRDHILVSDLTKHWLPIMKVFDKQKKEECSPSHYGAIRRELNVLWDYLFCYLPWWMEENPSAEIPFPRKICEFRRAFFWKRIYISDGLPKTAIDMYKARRSSKTTNSFVRYTKSFFQFVIDHRDEFKDIGLADISPNFENPVKDGDSPGSGPRKPSDKLAFPFSCISFLRNYFIALDDVGCELQKISLQPDSMHLIEPIHNLHWIDLEKLGITFSFNFFSEDQEYTLHLKEIPNVYTWHKGQYLCNGERIEARVPWLSCLRMLTADFYAGQRVQNFQWLNLDTFDQCAQRDNPGYFTTVQLEIDKTNPGRYINLQTSVFNRLLKEKQFQIETYGEPVELVYYENHESNESIRLRPLFRSPFPDKANGSLPFSDTTYSTVWRYFLIGAEYHFNLTVEGTLQYDFFERDDDADANLKVDPISLDQDNSSSKKIKNLKSRHTPHSMRNTYITWMLDLVDTEILMAQVGHSALSVTLHYNTPGPSVILSELERADRLLVGNRPTNMEASIFSGNAVKPANNDSSLRRSLQENLPGAIADQHMFSIENENIICKDTGIALIKQLPVTSLAVFNHCICPLGGLCPKEVLDITNAPHRCGLCPIAVFSIDNAEAIEAKRRQIQDHIQGLKKHIKLLKLRKEPRDAVIRFERDLKISALELIGYSSTANVIKSQLEKINSQTREFICRAPDILRKAAALTSDYEHIGQRILSQLADANAFPEYMNPDYLVRINRQLRESSLDFDIESPDPIKIAADHIASLMQLHNLTFNQLSNHKSAIKLISVE